MIVFRAAILFFIVGMNKTIETWTKKLYTRIIVHEEWRGYDTHRYMFSTMHFCFCIKLVEPLENQWICEWCKVKGVDKRLDQSV